MAQASWFVRVRYGSSEWIEGPFENQDEAFTHVRLSTGEGRGLPKYHLRMVRLESLDAESIITRLADWIEANVEGSKVSRDTGLVSRPREA